MAEHTRFVLDEPPVWGSAESPLLPSEWEPRIRSCTVPNLYRLRGERRLKVALGTFCRKEWSQRVFAASGQQAEGGRRRRPATTDRSGPFGELAGPVLKCLEQNTYRLGDALNVPLFTKRVLGETALLGIPVLQTMRRRLRAAHLLGPRLADFLSGGTFEELLHLIGHLRESLDLWMTARMWLADYGDGVLRVMQLMFWMHFGSCECGTSGNLGCRLAAPTTRSRWPRPLAAALGCGKTAPGHWSRLRAFLS